MQRKQVVGRLFILPVSLIRREVLATETAPGVGGLFRADRGSPSGTNARCRCVNQVFNLLSHPSLLHFEIALEQAQSCLKATTETTWHVMLLLLQSRDLLRKDPEKRDYSV
jgi:hypothetical protein